MMDKKEILDSVNLAIFHALANLHTATIAKVENVRNKTIDVRPVINRVVNGESKRLPLCIKVPPIFLRGGGSYTAYPISPGDYCLLIIAERCFDRWYAGQDFQAPLEFRMHDYSDGLALVGLFNGNDAPSIPSVITQIGDTYQEGEYVHAGNRTQTGDFNLTGNMDIDGDLNVTGTISCNRMVINGVEFGTHIHDENDSGGPTDGPRNP